MHLPYMGLTMHLKYTSPASPVYPGLEAGMFFSGSLLKLLKIQISCMKCKLQYVGSTCTEFKVRFRNHESSMVTNKKSCEMAEHFKAKLLAIEKLIGQHKCSR